MCVHIMTIVAMADNYEHDLPPNYIWLFKSLKCSECVVGSLVISFLSHLQATPPSYVLFLLSTQMVQNLDRRCDGYVDSAREARKTPNRTWKRYETVGSRYTRVWVRSRDHNPEDSRIAVGNSLHSRVSNLERIAGTTSFLHFSKEQDIPSVVKCGNGKSPIKGGCKWENPLHMGDFPLPCLITRHNQNHAGTETGTDTCCTSFGLKSPMESTDKNHSDLQNSELLRIT